MYKICYILLILKIILLFLFSVNVQASVKKPPGLLITPTRMILENRIRSGVITLVNNGGMTGVYKLKFINKRMTADGKLEDIDDKDNPINDMVRISPRRVILNPGDVQNIRILIRKPKKLQDGEYRTHLSFVVESIEDKLNIDPLEEIDKQEKSMSIAIRANYGVTIPVIYRYGRLEKDVNISNVTLSNANNKNRIKFNINRSGNMSVYGDIDIFYVQPDGKKHVLRNLGGLAVYTPNKFRKFDFNLKIPEGIKISKGGAIKVLYKSKEDDKGELLASTLYKI